MIKNVKGLDLVFKEYASKIESEINREFQQYVFYQSSMKLLTKIYTAIKFSRS